MQGYEAVLDAIVGYLEAEMPAKLEELRSRLGDDGPLSIDELPEVQLFATEGRAQLPLKDYPAIIAIAQPKRNVRLLDVTEDPPASRWASDYGVRLYLWARGSSYGATNRIRNRLSLAVTELLLSSPSLGLDWLRVNPATWTENPAEGAADRQRRSISATYLQFEATIEETLEGTVAHEPPLTPIVTGTGPHPALD